MKQMPHFGLPGQDCTPVRREYRSRVCWKFSRTFGVVSIIAKAVVSPALFIHDGFSSNDANRISVSGCTISQKARSRKMLDSKVRVLCLTLRQLTFICRLQCFVTILYCFLHRRNQVFPAEPVSFGSSSAVKWPLPRRSAFSSRARFISIVLSARQYNCCTSSMKNSRSMNPRPCALQCRGVHFFCVAACLSRFLVERVGYFRMSF